MNIELNECLYSAEQIQAGEKLVAASLNIELFELMLRAGKATFNIARQCYPYANHWVVVCGGGNNGGDGYVVATLAKQAGIAVSLFHHGDITRLNNDALRAQQQWLECGGLIQDSEDFISDLTADDLIIDALLGIGLKGEVRSLTCLLIDKLNQSRALILSVDIPSGLCANTGQVLAKTVKADLTVTFIGIKKGLVTGKARNCVGDLRLAGLGVQEEMFDFCATSTRLINTDSVSKLIPQRMPASHKGYHGRLLALGGNEGFGGAIILASLAAMRTGVGLGRTLTHSDNVTALLTTCPEIMTTKWLGDPETVTNHVQWASTLLLGPGLGVDSWAQTAFKQVKRASKPKVLDADALTLLSMNPNIDEMRVITPHPGEAAKLLNITATEVESDRYQAVEALQVKYGGVVVLKGAGTLVSDGQSVFVCNKGNQGMATGGMGDVLSGVIASMLAQGLSPMNAALLGVELHSSAGDLAALNHGKTGMLASDLIPYLRQLVN